MPTWNYTVVEASGRPERIDDRDSVRAILNTLAATYEAGQPAPWTMDAMPAEFTGKMMDGIVADVERAIEEILRKSWLVLLQNADFLLESDLAEHLSRMAATSANIRQPRARDCVARCEPADSPPQQALSCAPRGSLCPNAPSPSSSL